eukprot:TRINITY_DN8520_c0_g2_i1.p1 TRINITY_DN8520_c0_g2~~TRINITY_DN8520_c0_g2_i1.p1  ORF type:complete len:150 (-),score=37.74 TRINITY_DN8520_c0_g2_i1:84-533(-)
MGKKHVKGKAVKKSGTKKPNFQPQKVKLTIQKASGQNVPYAHKAVITQGRKEAFDKQKDDAKKLVEGSTKGDVEMGGDSKSPRSSPKLQAKSSPKLQAQASPKAKAAASPKLGAAAAPDDEKTKARRRKEQRKAIQAKKIEGKHKGRRF